MSENKHCFFPQVILVSLTSFSDVTTTSPYIITAAILRFLSGFQGVGHENKEIL